jgi:hypothetical protein
VASLFTTCRDVFTVPKIAAMFDAVVQSPVANFVVWLDSDASFFRAPDARFWAWTRKFDVATIQRKGGHPDTGIVVLDATARAAKCLVTRLRGMLFNESEYRAARSINDIALFDYFLLSSHALAMSALDGALPLNAKQQLMVEQVTRPPAVEEPRMRRALMRVRWDSATCRALHVGYFAVGCRDRAFNISRPAREWPQWMRASNRYKPAKFGACPGETPSTSPFNLFEYMTHHKSSGPMHSFAHTEVGHELHRRQRF